MSLTNNTIRRRDFVRHAGSVLIAGIASSSMPLAVAETGAISVEPLPYSYDSLEPFIDAQTMHLHHDKHYQAYADGFNKALGQEPSLKTQTPEALLANLEGVPPSIRTAVRNSGGGYVNHKFFWQLLRKNNGAEPRGELATGIDKAFGSFTAFQTKFAEAATKVFGSGWAWLTLSPDKTLTIQQTANQDTPVSSHHIPLLGIDVWEHAYYLKYQNRRAEYITAFQQVINWDFVSARYADSLKG